MNDLQLARTLIEQAENGTVDPALIRAAFTGATTGESHSRRSIERDINHAIRERRPLRRTRYGHVTSQVTVHKSNNNDIRRVYLHGNLIAVVIDGLVVANLDVFNAWPTVTTASRLRALGLDAYIRKGEANIDALIVFNYKFA